MRTISTLTWEVAVYSRNMRVEQGSVNTEQCEQPVSVKVWNCGTVNSLPSFKEETESSFSTALAYLYLYQNTNVKQPNNRVNNYIIWESALKSLAPNLVSTPALQDELLRSYKYIYQNVRVN